MVKMDVDTWKGASIKADYNMNQLIENPIEVIPSVEADKIWKSVYTQRTGAKIRISAKRDQTNTGNQRINRDTDWMACLDFGKPWICSKLMQFKPTKR